MARHYPPFLIIIFRLVIILFLDLCPSASSSLILVNASLYPTKPISSTTYRAGRVVDVQWKDDGKTPRLGDYCTDGKGVVVELIWGNEVVLEPLGVITNPKDKFLKIQIDPHVGNASNGSGYYIRFTPPPPYSNAPIYTARFKITDLDPFSSDSGIANVALGTIDSSLGPASATQVVATIATQSSGHVSPAPQSLDPTMTVGYGSGYGTNTASVSRVLRCEIFTLWISLAAVVLAFL